MRTSFPQENGGSDVNPKHFPNILGQLNGQLEQKNKPEVPENIGSGKRRVLATMYTRSGCYRLY